MTIPKATETQSLRIRIGGRAEYGLNQFEGTIVFQPTQRLNLADFALQLPSSFEVEVNGTSEGSISEPIINMLVNNEQWCWKITERLPSGKTFYTNIPKLEEGELLEYFELIEIDPETLDPIVQVPAWQALEDRVANAEVNIANLEQRVAILEQIIANN